MAFAKYGGKTGAIGILLLLLLELGCCKAHYSVTLNETPASNHSSSATSEGDGQQQVQNTIYFNNPHLLKERRRGFFRSALKPGGTKPFIHQVESIGGIYLQDEATVIASQLRRVCNQELAVTTMQAIYDTLPFANLLANEDAQVRDISDRIRDKLRKYTKLLSRNKQHTESLYQSHTAELTATDAASCCNIQDSDLMYSHNFGTRVSWENGCDFIISPDFISNAAFSPGMNLSQTFFENLNHHPSIKWQYFMSADGSRTEFPAHRVACSQNPDDSRRSLYLHAISPQSKYIVIMIDHGNSLSANQLQIAKAIAKYILSTLSHSDMVALIGLAAEPKSPRVDDCLSKKLVAASVEAKLHFSRFIDGLSKSKEMTNHSLGFAKAFEMMQSFLQFDDNLEGLIIYISRGLLSSLPEARTVLETISDGNFKVNDRVVINTYAVIDDGKHIMYEKSFLQDIADQNFGKYEIPSRQKYIKRGVMVPVNSTNNFDLTIGRFYSVLKFGTPNISHYSLPYWDDAGKDLVVSLTQPCFHENHVIGVVGIDLHLADIVEHVLYYISPAVSYAFMFDESGYALAHPFLTHPDLVSEQPMHTDILHLENRPGFETIRANMLRLESGSELLEVLFDNDTSVTDSGSVDSLSPVYVKYTWKKVGGSPYIVCIVTENVNVESRELKTGNVVAPSNVVYHRIDKLPDVSKCIHLKQIATTKFAAIFLSAQSFNSPFEYLAKDESMRTIQSYMAYMSDNTKLIANPGLKSNIRSDLSALVHIVPEWKKRLAESNDSLTVVRRYIATPQGLFQVYPGTVIDKVYDPSKRSWFTRALEYPGHVVLTAPYLDVGGAGYIITLSHTVYEGKPASMHSATDSVVAVMGMDFTLSYFYKLLLDIIPVCSLPRITCFIMDDRGYLIAHPDLIEPNGKGPVEQQHITHKEPLVASDILSRKGFVRKRLCNSFVDRTVQRYYKFNISLEGVLTNLVHGEHCAKYQIVAIPGTNTFVGVVNQTCDAVTAFCPCSVVDRLCLNCHRMEQTDCECPCECPLEMNLCTGNLLDEEDANPSCPHYPDDVQSAEVGANLFIGLKQCIDSDCKRRATSNECIGVVGCEWCQRDSDGKTPNLHPFCTDQRKCFGGVHGARTPYADEITDTPPSEELLGYQSAPVGPVVGGIMGCFLIVALAVYCYRNNANRHSHHLVSSIDAQATHVRMSQLDNEPDEMNDPQDEQLHGVGHGPIVRFGCDNAVGISPYRVNTNYRRPLGVGGESDHGYSTMTPPEDSEHIPYADPLLLIGRDKYRPTAPKSIASSSRASSPTLRPFSPPLLYTGTGATPLLREEIEPCAQTVVPDLHFGRHQMLAPVQVHVVDSH